MELATSLAPIFQAIKKPTRKPTISTITSVGTPSTVFVLKAVAIVCRLNTTTYPAQAKIAHLIFRRGCYRFSVFWFLCILNLWAFSSGLDNLVAKLNLGRKKRFIPLARHFCRKQR